MVYRQSHPQCKRQQCNDNQGDRHKLTIPQEQPRGVETEVEGVGPQHQWCDDHGAEVKWPLAVAYAHGYHEVENKEDLPRVDDTPDGEGPTGRGYLEEVVVGDVTRAVQKPTCRWVKQ